MKNPFRSLLKASRRVAKGLAAARTVRQAFLPLLTPPKHAKKPGMAAKLDPIAMPDRAPRERSNQNNEVVLVVEDESVVRLLVVEVLKDLGYRSLEAADGRNALRILQSSQRIDLLVTDIGLPELNGRQLADAARLNRPNLKVLFMTGYAEKAASSDFLEEGMDMIIKPFTTNALSEHIRQIIERSSRVGRAS
jgi:CheY-like chemotaxis protein